MAKKTYSIDLSLGYVPITINFVEDKEPVTIMFNPADDDMSRRLFEAEKRIDENVKELKDIKVNEDGTLDVDSATEFMTEKNRIIADAVDYAFGNKISDELFKYCSPTAVIGGRYYIEHFIEKIIPVIQEIREKEAKKAEAHNKKYYSKYRK